MAIDLKKRKIINDPVYGFISIPADLVLEIIEHPWFQRLRRIKQLGLTYYVYPSAVHSRFQHALGCMHLMVQAIEVLRSKGHYISDKEMEAVTLAILLHDIGHGPFSHTLEQSIVRELPHEKLSMLVIEKMNLEFNGRLSLAIDIFRDIYPKRFLHQLVSSQLDMDRLDYLSRDSFFTGVAEGVIATHRIIKMLDIMNDELVVEIKGIYSIENFIIARRLMYWQVYFHKTVMAAEYMLISILNRAKYLASQGAELFCTPALRTFLYSTVTGKEMEQNSRYIDLFMQLDDSDLFSSIKVWSNHDDRILAILCKSLINRRLYKVLLQKDPFGQPFLEKIRNAVKQTYQINDEETKYFVVQDSVSNNAYSLNDDKIKILFRDGTLLDISEASDQLNISVLSSTVMKHVLCYPKQVTTSSFSR